jgi:hypothetical protein
MSIKTKLLAAIGLFATGILVERRRNRRVGRLGTDATDRMGVPPVVDAEIIGGIASVDPEPLAQTAGEGIDLDANAAAHRRTP